jgi:hypothetical protein
VIRTPGFVIRVVAQMLGEASENAGNSSSLHSSSSSFHLSPSSHSRLGKSLGIREIRLTKDGGAVADLPTEHAKRLLALQGKPSNIIISHNLN